MWKHNRYTQQLASAVLSLEYIHVLQERNPIRGLLGEGGEEAMGGGERKEGIMKLDAALGEEEGEVRDLWKREK